MQKSSAIFNPCCMVIQKAEAYLSAGPPGRTHVTTTGRDLFLSSCAPPHKEKEYSLRDFLCCHIKKFQLRNCSMFVDIWRKTCKNFLLAYTSFKGLTHFM